VSPPVRVRMFAALRDAAGTASAEVRADRVSQLLDRLREEYGEPFATRLELASVVVDGVPVPSGEDAELTGAREVVLLPPFSGG
jgi:molybdopterin synthase sulfur carrier subunit